MTSATYGAAGELLQLNGDISETRTYNSRLQLTSINAGYNMNLEYRYDTTGHNNGQIASMMDNVTGEEIAYQYDSLKRLITAITTGPEWGLNFSYDGFGNRTAQTAIKGTAPSWQQAIDPANNHVVGWSYDANGNVTYSPETGTVSYDVENRLSSAGYAPDNRRVWLDRQNDSHFVQFYDPGGKLLGQYGTSLTVWVDEYTSGWGVWEDHENVYFGGRLTSTGGQVVYQDRLGSVRVRSSTAYPYPTTYMSYYPYGEERTTTSDDTVKFGTYTRDSQIGLDYADQRYYNWHAGRFLTPDRSGMTAARPGNPVSWNMYAYVNGDPVNHSDPTGRNIFGTIWDILNDIFGGDGGGGGQAPPGGDDGGGGGGGDPCGGDWFSPSPSPDCYVPPPVLPPVPTEAPPDCTVRIFGQSAMFSGDPIKHTYTEVQYAGKMSAQAEFLEGEPVPKDPKSTSKLSPQWLNGFDTFGHPYNTSISSTELWSKQEAWSVCDQLLSLESGYRNNTVTYNNWYPWSGPNSNSWTHSLLLAAGITGIPGMSNSQYPGWSNTSVPF